MKFPFKKVLRLTIMLSILVLACGFQTTLWYQLFNNFPAPLIWINILAYISIYRKPFPAIMTIYLMVFLICGFSAMPLKMAFFSLLPLFCLIYLIKTRIFWGGSGYYVIMCGLATVAYHIIYTLISLAFEKNIVALNLYERLGQMLITPIFALPVYFIMSYIDRHLGHELLAEHGVIE